MENYEALLREKYLLGTPKEQYEWVVNLVELNSKNERVATYLLQTVMALRDIPTISDTIKDMLDITIDVSLKSLK